MRQRRLSTTGDLRERIEKDWDATPPQTNIDIPVITHQQNLVESQKRMRESESNESLASSMAVEKKKTKVVNLVTQQEQHCPATVSLGRFERYDSSKSGISSDEDDDDEWVDVKKR